MFDIKQSIFGQTVTLPCGQCKNCRLSRANDWAIRCMHEAEQHKDNSFITLSYRPDDLPTGGTLVKNHFQQFMKGLRQLYPDQHFRFYMCGEYGGTSGRAHYHALLFGLDFEDKYHFKTHNGNKLYRSATLEKAWTKGHSWIGSVTFNSARYVARYIMVKVNGDLAADHYKRELVDGTSIDLLPEYTTMSLKPGIGTSWYEQNKHWLFEEDLIFMNNREYRVPHYYSKKFRESDPEAYKLLKAKRTRAYSLDCKPETDSPINLEPDDVGFNLMMESL